jgi:hypothetical protein
MLDIVTRLNTGIGCFNLFVLFGCCRQDVDDARRDHQFDEQGARLRIEFTRQY